MLLLDRSLMNGRRILVILLILILVIFPVGNYLISNPLAQQTSSVSPHGFLYPTGSNQYIYNNTCSNFLSTSSSMGMGGCYPVKDVYHTGYDIHADRWTPVRLVSDGIVIDINHNGWTCDPEHTSDQDQNVAVLVKCRTSAGLDFIVLYGHLNKNTLQVSVNRNVVLPMGTIIGYVGTYPCGGDGVHIGSGDHLHFGIYVPSWYNGSELPRSYEAKTADGKDDIPNNIGWGRIGKNYYATTFGWVHPINFIDSFAYPGTPVTDSQPSSDQQAKTDIENYMKQNTPYGGGQDESSFGSNLNWQSNYELRWMNYRYSFNGRQYSFTVYHITYTQNRNQRWVGYNDPITTFWQGWYYVGQ